MNLIHLSRAEYITLSTTGTLTKAGVTYTFDPLNNEYIVPKDDSGGGVTMDLLWENAKPNASFATQGVTIENLLDYKMLAIEFVSQATIHYTRNISFVSMSANQNVNNGLALAAPNDADAISGSNPAIDNRRAFVISPPSNLLYFRRGYYYNYTGSWVVDDNSCVPTRIYGIK